MHLMYSLFCGPTRRRIVKSVKTQPSMIPDASEMFFHTDTSFPIIKDLPDVQRAFSFNPGKPFTVPQFIPQNVKFQSPKLNSKTPNLHFLPSDFVQSIQPSQPLQGPFVRHTLSQQLFNFNPSTYFPISSQFPLNSAMQVHGPLREAGRTVISRSPFIPPGLNSNFNIADMASTTMHQISDRTIQSISQATGE